MYSLVLQRLFEVKNVKKEGHEPEPSTVGMLILSTKNQVIFRSFTIENGNASSILANQDRRIMPDFYGLKYSKTTVPLPKENVPNGILLTHCSKSIHAKKDFESRRIFIHVGNYPQDTEGCILLNSSYDLVQNTGVGSGSRQAVSTFYNILRIRVKDIRQLTLQIRDYHGFS